MRVCKALSAISGKVFLLGFEHGIRTPLALGQGDVSHPQWIGHIFQYAHARKKCIGLKDNTALARAYTHCRDIFSAQKDLSRRTRQEVGNELEQCGFSAA